MASFPFALHLILCLFCATSLALFFPSELPLFASRNHMNISSFNSSLLLSATIRGNLPAFTYNVEVEVGTPSTRVKLTFDTGTQTTWIASDALCNKKKTCTGFSKKSSHTLYSVYCLADACKLFHEGDNYQRANCRKAPQSLCKKTAEYLDGKNMDLELIRDILTFGEESSSLYFGFGIEGILRGSGDGVLGMARGGISILKQVNFSLVISHCFPPWRSPASSTLIFSDPSFPKDYEVMPLTTSEYQPTLNYYFVPIVGFRFDLDKMLIPKMDKHGGGGGGFYVDTGASFTQLLPSHFKKFITMFEERVYPVRLEKKIMGDLHCYKVPVDPYIDFPTVSILFENGVELTLPESNVLLYWPDYAPYDNCLAFMQTNSGHNIFGSYQQQTFRFAFDIGRKRFGVKLTPECDSVLE